MKAIPRKLWLWIALSAVLQLLPFPLAGPVPEWRRWFAWVCLVPLFLALQGDADDGTALSWKQSSVLGYVCGIAWYLGNCYWIYPTMHVYGALAEPVAAVILLLFAMYLGLYHALFALVWWWLRRRWSKQAVLVVAPFLWVAVELARARITGFPWDLLGYTQVGVIHLAELSRWTGVMGLSLVVAVGNAIWLWTPKRFRYAGVVAGVCLTALLGIGLAARSMWDPPLHSPMAVLLQDNLSVGAEANGLPHETREGLLADLTRRTMAAGSNLQGHAPSVVLWPEAPADFVDGDPLFREGLSQLAKAEQAPVIADSVAMEPGGAQGEPAKVYNSASFFAADGRYAGRYDKMHLVPFGEYTPFKRLLFFAGHLLDNVGGFVPGTKRTMFATGGHTYGVFICYESIFGDEVRELAKNGADVLVNLSDDGWYGDSSAPWEHLDMVRMRAIENDRWVLRSTNTGVTVTVAPDGTIKSEMPRHVRGALLGVFGYVSGTTFYTRHGDWLPWMCVVVVVVMVGFGFTRRVAVD